MRLRFWRKEKPKRARKTGKRKARLNHETARFDQSQRRGDEIQMKLDAISAILRKHDLDVRDRLEQHDTEIKGRIEQIATARKIIRENNLDEIIREKLSQGLERNAIVKELVSRRVCSRATAYRYVTRQSKPLGVPIGSR
jgi:hypothetical protein